MKSTWPGLAARILGCSSDLITARGGTDSFAALGGTSLQAAALVALAERELGQTVDLAGLLSTEPFAHIVTHATAYRPVVPATDDAYLRPLLPGQEPFLVMDERMGGTANHLLFTARADAPLDEAALTATLAALTQRHEALRTVFVLRDDSRFRRVLPRWRPRLLVEEVTPAAGDDPVATAQARLAAASSVLLDPYGQPPVVFVWTKVKGGGDLLSLLFQHAALDGWSVGLFWREFAALYAARGCGELEPGCSPDVAVARHEQMVSSGMIAEAAEMRAKELSAVADIIQLPGDLIPPPEPDPRGVRHRFGLGARARDAAESMARQAGVTRTAVLLTAWSLVLARRAGAKDFLLAITVAGRPTSDLQELVAVCTHLAPVRVTLEDDASVLDCVTATAARMAQAISAVDVPFGQLFQELEKLSENPHFPRYCLAAHDELVPQDLLAGPVRFTLHEGHCGGTALDAILFVQRWGDEPRLALEYRPSVITAVEAAELADAFEQTIVDLAEAARKPLASVRGMSLSQRDRLERLGVRPSCSDDPGPWQIIEAAAADGGADLAVRADDAELTYADLVAAVTAQSSIMAGAGVGEGDRVVIAVPRSAAEVVSVLATVRLGAAYVAADPAAPDAHLHSILSQTAPRAIVASDEVAKRLLALMSGCAVVAPWTPQTVASSSPAPAAAPDPDRVNYVAFTSGSTGRPKGVMVPDRGVVRLLHRAEYMHVLPGQGFLRLAPLSFDASTLEIYAPLLSGGFIDVFPDGPVSPSPLAEHLLARGTENIFLTAGLLRLMVDHRPDAFAAARHVMTGGDVVPSEQVRTLLSRYPGLRVSNFYGPTENTVVTTAFTADDPCQVTEPLPIGAAVPGSAVLVLDDAMNPVPPGGIGELYTSGAGLAVGYLGNPEETSRWFRPHPDGGERLYRTGDLVRWDGMGRLRFLGRGDNQVKISGHRIEPDAVTARLRAHPSVRDAVVAATSGDASSRRLLAGVVVADKKPDLVADLRSWVADAMPGYAVPAVWALVDTLPLTANGKVDVASLEEEALTSSG